MESSAIILDGGLAYHCCTCTTQLIARGWPQKIALSIYNQLYMYNISDLYQWRRFETPRFDLKKWFVFNSPGWTDRHNLTHNRSSVGIWIWYLATSSSQPLLKQKYPRGKLKILLATYSYIFARNIENCLTLQNLHYIGNQIFGWNWNQHVQVIRLSNSPSPYQAKYTWSHFEKPFLRSKAYPIVSSKTSLRLITILISTWRAKP